jgi:Mrp family chromosome partitioning ATPase
MRRALAAIREQPELKTIGVVSILPREGKTVIAASLAQVAANNGCRVILVDAAPYNRTLTSQLAPDAKAGLHDVLKKRLSVADVLWDVSDTSLAFLPLGEDAPKGADRSNGPPGFCGVQDVLPDTAAAADLVVVDLPPATLVADLREIASAVDGFLLVVEWGNTSVDVISSALACNYEMQRKLIGVILNKVDIPQLRTYDDSLAVLYDQTRYSVYLNDEGSAARSARWFKKASRIRANALQQKRVKQQ